MDTSSPRRASRITRRELIGSGLAAGVALSAGSVVAPGRTVRVVEGRALLLGRVNELRVDSGFVSSESKVTTPEFLRGPAGRGVFQS